MTAGHNQPEPRPAGGLCDGVEHSPSHCRCPCEGCRYHCSLHQEEQPS